MVKSNLKCQTLKRRGNIFENFLFGKTDHESTSLLGNNYYSVAYNNIWLTLKCLISLWFLTVFESTQFDGID